MTRNHDRLRALRECLTQGLGPPLRCDVARMRCFGWMLRLYPETRSPIFYLRLQAVERSVTAILSQKLGIWRSLITYL